MKIKTELITPKRAENYLKNNLSNRKIRDKIVDNYARQMNKNLWRENIGDTIKISKIGMLLDGQHRLKALIKSGKSFIFNIAFDVDNDAFQFIDTGTPRHAGDILFINNIKNANLVSKIIRTYNGLKNDHVSVDWGKYKYSNAEILDLYNNESVLYDEAAKLGMRYYLIFNKIIPPSVISSYYLFFRDLRPDKVDLFFEKLCKGIEITSNKDPILILRNKLMENKLNYRLKLTNEMKFTFFIKTWNNFIKGKNMSLLRFYPNERRPIPIK